VARISELDKLGAELISLANTRGGPDNITVVAARFDGPGLPEAEEDPAYSVIETEELARTPPEMPTPAQPPPPPQRRTGSPAGMAMLVIGTILVLLAAFLAFGG
jgi:hypothetical protein